jgi:hypothetical protein
VAGQGRAAPVVLVLPVAADHRRPPLITSAALLG